MCACRRSRSATSGRPRSAPPRSPGWTTTRSAMWRCFRGRPTARWRWPRRTRVLGEASEVRDIRFEQVLLLDERDPGRRLGGGDIARRRQLRWWRPTRTANTRGEPPQSCMPRRTRQPPAYDVSTLLAAHPRCEDGDEVRAVVGPARCSVRSGVHRSGRACTPPTGPSRHRAGRGRAAQSNPLAAETLTACTRRCWMPVSSPSSAHPERPRALGEGVLAAAVGCAPAARLRTRPQRALLLHDGDQSRCCRGRGRPRRARRARARCC